MAKKIIVLGSVETLKPHETDIVYCHKGICPSLKATNYKNPVKVLKEWKRRELRS